MAGLCLGDKLSPHAVPAQRGALLGKALLDLLGAVAAGEHGCKEGTSRACQTGGGARGHPSAAAASQMSQFSHTMTLSPPRTICVSPGAACMRQGFPADQQAKQDSGATSFCRASSSSSSRNATTAFRSEGASGTGCDAFSLLPSLRERALVGWLSSPPPSCSCCCCCWEASAAPTMSFAARVERSNPACVTWRRVVAPPLLRLAPRGCCCRRRRREACASPPGVDGASFSPLERSPRRDSLI